MHPLIADSIVGHGDREKSVQSLYLSISDAAILNAIDKMKFDVGETAIFVKISSPKLKGALGFRLHFTNCFCNIITYSELPTGKVTKVYQGSCGFGNGITGGKNALR